jgi:hypothetical protein
MTPDLAWEVAVGGAVVARGECRMERRDHDRRAARVTFGVPSLRPDVVMEGVFRVWRIHPDRSLAGRPAERRFPLLGENPFLGREAWLRQLRIVVFDPEGMTSEALKSLGVPHERTTNPDALQALHPGFLLIAEGLSFRDYRALPGLLLQAATSGIPTLCLAPIGGEMELPILRPDPTRRIRVEFGDRSVADVLDKHSGTNAWGELGVPFSSSFHLVGTASALVAEVRKDSEGWAWIAIRGEPPQASMVVCGFGLVENWERTPAARRLLLVVMEHTAGRVPDASSAAAAIGPREKTQP